MESKERILYNIKHLKQLVFEVTDSCNLNCKYCGLSSLYQGNENRNGERLSFHKARLIIDYLFSIRGYSSKVIYPLNIGFYGGEPLLNMKLIKQIITYINKSRFPKVTYGMTTNALLLDKHIDFLVENKFNLLISLDGNEIHQSYRVDLKGRNSFHRVFKNVTFLQNKYPEYFQNFVQFNAVLHSMNNVEEIYYFFKNQFNKKPLIIPLNKVGISKDKINEFKLMYQNLNQSFIQSGKCETIEAEMFTFAPKILNLSEYIFLKSGNVYNDFNDLIFNTSNIVKIQTGTCSPFSKKMFVTVNGQILQCERIDHRFVLGEIKEDQVDLNLENIANNQNKYTHKISKQCFTCRLAENCPQCVYNIEDIDKKNPTCIYYCNEEKYAQYEKMTLDYLREHPYFYEKILKEVTIK